MKQSHPRHLTTILISLTVLAAFLVGYQVGRPSPMRSVWAAQASLSSPQMDWQENIPTQRPVELFREAYMRLQGNFVESIPNTDKLTYGAIRGMLATLNDPYTRFMDPKEFADFNSENVGHFAGIGASLTMTEIPSVTPKNAAGTVAPTKCPVCGTIIGDLKEYRPTVVEPMPGSPAKAAGLQPGDFILKVDDMSTDGKMIDDVVDKIRGPEGSKVTLTVIRKGSEKPIDVTLTRANIEVPAVESKTLDDKIGYVRLMSFNEKTVQETRAALMKFNEDGDRGVVLDLRNNPGGLMIESVKVASMLLPEADKVILSTKDRSGETMNEVRIGDELYKGPLVVLVNKGSASASEILTGALKDYKRATIVGESTFGKALVQTVINMSNGSAMAITTAHYYTPSGFDLAKKGIAPDHVIALDKDAKAINESDNQAQEAVRLLKEKMAKAE